MSSIPAHNGDLQSQHKHARLIVPIVDVLAVICWTIADETEDLVRARRWSGIACDLADYGRLVELEGSSP